MAESPRATRSRSRKDLVLDTLRHFCYLVPTGKQVLITYHPLVDGLDKARLYAVVTNRIRFGDTREHVWFLVFSKSLDDWVRIKLIGWSLREGGTGPGPGIYKLQYTRRATRRFYQAWDWDPADRPRDPDEVAGAPTSRRMGVV